MGATFVVSVGNAFVRGVPWIPDLDALAAEEQRHRTLRSTAGVTLTQFLSLLEAGAVVVDARPAAAFAESHLAAPRNHVLNVPEDVVVEHLPRLFEFQGFPFVLYCSSETCESAQAVYEAMVQAGFDAGHLFVYFPGWEGILAAGLETTSGEES